MAARGSIVKDEITKKILNVFEGSFLNDKEIRIPMLENGELIEVKVVLTAAKTNIGGGAGPVQQASEVPADNKQNYEVTPEEKKEVKTLLESFGF